MATRDPAPGPGDRAGERTCRCAGGHQWRCPGAGHRWTRRSRSGEAAGRAWTLSLFRRQRLQTGLVVRQQVVRASGPSMNTASGQPGLACASAGQDAEVRRYSAWQNVSHGSRSGCLQERQDRRVKPAPRKAADDRKRTLERPVMSKMGTVKRPSLRAALRRGPTSFAKFPRTMVRPSLGVNGTSCAAQYTRAPGL